MWLTAVITFKDPPLARDGHVFLKMSPLHCHVTVFVGTGDEFEKTRCQVNLLHNQNIRTLQQYNSDLFFRPEHSVIWSEIFKSYSQFEMKSNIICGVIYRQHNSPESFQTYFDEILEKLSKCGKPIYVIGDFNINLLNAETCNFTNYYN